MLKSFQSLTKLGGLKQSLKRTTQLFNVLKNNSSLLSIFSKRFSSESEGNNFSRIDRRRNDGERVTFYFNFF